MHQTRVGIAAALLMVAAGTVQMSSAQPGSPGPGTPIDPPTLNGCIAAGPGIPDPAPGSGCLWQYDGHDPWVGTPYETRRIDEVESFGPETVAYRYEGEVPLPCEFTPLVLEKTFQETVTRTHRVRAHGTIGASMGISAEAEASYLGILAARVKSEARANVELGAGWEGEWTEEILRREDVDVPICHEHEREASVRKISVTMVTPWEHRLFWSAECGSTPFNTTSICESGQLTGAATGYSEKYVEHVLRKLRDCPRLCDW